MPKTGRGANKLHAAGTDSWVVVDQQSNVAFSDREGPWLYVRPATGIAHKDHARWVHHNDDKDFTVEQP